MAIRVGVPPLLGREAMDSRDVTAAADSLK
jgi:hypothetical protein